MSGRVEVEYVIREADGKEWSDFTPPTLEWVRECATVYAERYPEDGPYRIIELTHTLTTTERDITATPAPERTEP